MSNSSDETVEIGKKVLHALNNSGYVSVSDPHRVIIETVLLDLRLIHGITPDTPPGDPDFEIPLIVHLVGKNRRAAPPCRPPPVASRQSGVEIAHRITSTGHLFWTSMRSVAFLSMLLFAVGWLRVMIDMTVYDYRRDGEAAGKCIFAVLISLVVWRFSVAKCRRYPQKASPTP